MMETTTSNSINVKARLGNARLGMMPIKKR